MGILWFGEWGLKKKRTIKYKINIILHFKWNQKINRYCKCPNLFHLSPDSNFTIQIKLSLNEFEFRISIDMPYFLDSTNSSISRGSILLLTCHTYVICTFLNTNFPHHIYDLLVPKFWRMNCRTDQFSKRNAMS